ncbi:MAG: protein of unknown function DUF2523 [Inoviridae sp.]|nr:MAG: protein of unknown function DUF2523 [Inoviridae sp.]
MQYFFVFLASVVPFFAQFLTASVARVAVAVGFGTVAYAGVGLIFDSIIQKLNASTNLLSPHIATFIHLLGIDTALNIIMSAGFALMVLKGANKAGDIRKSVWRKPGDKSDVDWSA